MPRKGQAGTWNSEDMIAAYACLHDMGLAHSVEAWHEGELAGGLYGVGIGHMFYGESMFSHKTDASKVALAHLVAQLRRWDFGMIDCQMNTPHLASLGAREIPRAEFIRHLQELVRYPDMACRWQFDYEPDALAGRECSVIGRRLIYTAGRREFLKQGSRALCRDARTIRWNHKCSENLTLPQQSHTG